MYLNVGLCIEGSKAVDSFRPEDPVDAGGGAEVLRGVRVNGLGERSRWPSADRVRTGGRDGKGLRLQTDPCEKDR